MPRWSRSSAYRSRCSPTPKAEAIQPSGTWNAEEDIAFAVVLVKPDGEEAFRRDSRDPIDRAPDEELLAAARSLGLDPVHPESPHRRHSQPITRRCTLGSPGSCPVIRIRF